MCAHIQCQLLYKKSTHNFYHILDQNYLQILFSVNTDADIKHIVYDMLAEQYKMQAMLMLMFVLKKNTKKSVQACARKINGLYDYPFRSFIYKCSSTYTR